MASTMRFRWNGLTLWPPFTGMDRLPPTKRGREQGGVGHAELMGPALRFRKP